jgi:hypothetical protein
MISLINHDFQGSGQQWGRDEIYPDTMFVGSFLKRFFQVNFTSDRHWKVS